MMTVENKPIYIVTGDIYLRFPEIMEEELDDLIEFLDDNHIVYKGATKKFKDLQRKNKELKENLKDWSRIFDTFSKREYAHRYLEERRKEIPNLLAPDSDEIYREYYKLRDRIDKAEECIKNFLCGEEYIKVDGVAIANNYAEVLQILKDKE